jgi:hypothetical protein
MTVPVPGKTNGVGVTGTVIVTGVLVPVAVPLFGGLEPPVVPPVAGSVGRTELIGFIGTICTTDTTGTGVTTGSVGLTGVFGAPPPRPPVSVGLVLTGVGVTAGAGPAVIPLPGLAIATFVTTPLCATATAMGRVSVVATFTGIFDVVDVSGAFATLTALGEAELECVAWDIGSGNDTS